MTYWVIRRTIPDTAALAGRACIVHITSSASATNVGCNLLTAMIRKDRIAEGRWAVNGVGNGVVFAPAVPLLPDTHTRRW